MELEEISIIQFREWEQHPVTKKFLAYLDSFEKDIKGSLHNSEVLLHPQIAQRAAVYAGIFQIITLIKNITLEELENNNA